VTFTQVEHLDLKLQHQQILQNYTEKVQQSFRLPSSFPVRYLQKYNTLTNKQFLWLFWWLRWGPTTCLSSWC